MQHICEFVNYKPAYNLHWPDENGQNHKNLITMTSNLKECSHKTTKTWWGWRQIKWNVRIKPISIHSEEEARKIQAFDILLWGHKFSGIIHQYSKFTNRVLRVKKFINPRFVKGVRRIRKQVSLAVWSSIFLCILEPCLVLKLVTN